MFVRTQVGSRTIGRFHERRPFDGSRSQGLTVNLGRGHRGRITVFSTDYGAANSALYWSLQCRATDAPRKPPLRGASYDHWIGCSKPGRWIQIIQKGLGLLLPARRGLRIISGV